MTDRPFDRQPSTPDQSPRAERVMLVKVKEYLSSPPTGVEIARCVRTDIADGSGTEDGNEEVWVVIKSHVDVDKTVVAVRVNPDTGYSDSGGYRYVWQQMAGGESGRFMLIGAELDGIGFYDGGTYQPSSVPIAVGSTFAAPGVGSGESVVFAHMLEANTDGTDTNLKITAGAIGFGFYIGMSDEDPPRKVYAGYAFRPKSCTTTNPSEGDI